MFNFKINGFDIVDALFTGWIVTFVDRSEEGDIRPDTSPLGSSEARSDFPVYSSVLRHLFYLGSSSRKDFVHLVDPEGANYAAFSNRPSDRLTKVCRWEKDASFGYTSSSRLGLFSVPYSRV